MPVRCESGKVAHVVVQHGIDCYGLLWLMRGDRHDCWVVHEHGVDWSVCSLCVIVIGLIQICRWEEIWCCSDRVLRCLIHDSLCHARTSGLLCARSCWCNRGQWSNRAASPAFRRIVVHLRMSGQTVLPSTVKSMRHVHRSHFRRSTYNARPQVRHGYGLAPV